MSLTPSFLFWKKYSFLEDNILVFRSDGFPITFEKKGGSTIHAKDIKHALTFFCVCEHSSDIHVRGRTWFLTLCLRWILGWKVGDLLKEKGGLRIIKTQKEECIPLTLSLAGLAELLTTA